MDSHDESTIDVTENQEAADNGDEQRVEPNGAERGPEVAPVEVPSECPVCRGAPVNPIQINCRHIFCFLCIKGVHEISGSCPMCRAEIGIDFNRRQHRVLGTIKLPSSSPDGHYWFYEGKRGWWMYDADTCREIEQAYQQDEPQMEKVLVGEVRVIDLKNMKQYPREEPARSRRICRETLALEEIRGLSGLAGQDLKQALDMMRFADDIRT